jgi:hypothetical protein
MQSMSAELADKIDRDSVGFIVHEKYEEIVRYLQDALQSSLEDENNFKEKADEIQEMVILLSNSKADRTEIANMQEMMVKSEALLKKVGANVNLKDKMKDLVSRKELEALLAGKVDRTEFEDQLQSAVTNSRRTRKLASLATNLNTPLDRAMMPNSEILPTISNESIRSSPPTYTNNNSIDNTPSMSGRKVTISSNRPSSAGNMGNQVFTIDPPVPGTQSQVQYQPIPVIAIGQGLSSPNRKSPDFGSYLKTKGGKKTLIASASANLEAPPGAFRKATEGGVPGGVANDRPRSASNLDGFGNSEYPYTDPQYSMSYADQARLTDHLAYLHGPIVGGGFNVRNAHLMKGAPGSKPIVIDDVEGKGM